MRNKKVLEDFIKVSGGILKSLSGAREYSKEKFKKKFAKSLENLDFVKKEDFELVKAMYVKLKGENMKLSKKVNLLEKKITKLK